MTKRLETRKAFLKINPDVWLKSAILLDGTAFNVHEKEGMVLTASIAGNMLKESRSVGVCNLGRAFQRLFYSFSPFRRGSNTKPQQKETGLRKLQHGKSEAGKSMIRQVPKVSEEGMVDPEPQNSGPRQRKRVGSASQHAENLKPASSDARHIVRKAESTGTDSSILEPHSSKLDGGKRMLFCGTSWLASMTNAKRHPPKTCKDVKK